MLQGIRVIKYFAWERSFVRSITMYMCVFVCVGVFVCYNTISYIYE